MVAFFCPPPFIRVAAFDPPGSYTLNANSYIADGTDTFIIPNYGSYLFVELWGGGAGGGNNQFNGTPNPGTDSTCTGGLVAGGGSAGNGGTASGGDINTPGGNASGTNQRDGGNSPNGGSGGLSGTTTGAQPGGAPGGGGGGNHSTAANRWGGGAGAYCKKTYANGELTPGASLTLVAGKSGQGRGTSNHGGAGRIYIEWG